MCFFDCMWGGFVVVVWFCVCVFVLCGVFWFIFFFQGTCVTDQVAWLLLIYDGL